MSALTTPQHFQSQPQYRVDPDVSNPLGARIIGGCIPGVCSLRGNAASIVKTRGQFGLGTAGGSGNYATAGPARVLIGRASGAAADSRDVTFVFVGYVSNNNTLWFYDGQSDGVSSWWFKTDASGNLSASYGQSSNLAGVVNIPNGPVVLICHGGTNGGQVARTWVNGVEYAGSAATDSWVNSPAFTGVFGSSAFPTSNTFAGIGNLALVLRGNVTSAEAKRITDNPWALLKAPDVSRMFFGPPAAGSSTTETGTLADVMSVSVTSVLVGAESGTLADTPAGSNVTAAAVSESGSATDAPGAVATYAVSTTEAGSLADLGATGGVTAAAASETGALSDNPGASALSPAAITETGALSDASSLLATLVAVVAETVSAVEQSSAAQASVLVHLEFASASDSDGASVVFTAPCTELVTLADIAAWVGAVLSDPRYVAFCKRKDYEASFVAADNSASYTNKNDHAYFRG